MSLEAMPDDILKRIASNLDPITRSNFVSASMAIKNSVLPHRSHPPHEWIWINAQFRRLLRASLDRVFPCPSHARERAAIERVACDVLPWRAQHDILFSWDPFSYGGMSTFSDLLCRAVHDVEDDGISWPTSFPGATGMGSTTTDAVDNMYRVILAVGIVFTVAHVPSTMSRADGIILAYCRYMVYMKYAVIPALRWGTSTGESLILSMLPNTWKKITRVVHGNTRMLYRMRAHLPRSMRSNALRIKRIFNAAMTELHRSSSAKTRGP